MTGDTPVMGQLGCGPSCWPILAQTTCGSLFPFPVCQSRQRGRYEQEGEKTHWGLDMVTMSPDGPLEELRAHAALTRRHGWPFHKDTCAG